VRSPRKSAYVGHRRCTIRVFNAPSLGRPRPQGRRRREPPV